MVVAKNQQTEILLGTQNKLQSWFPVTSDGTGQRTDESVVIVILNLNAKKWIIEAHDKKLIVDNSFSSNSRFAVQH